MSAPSNAIRRVAIAGTGPDAWIAAAALLRAFRQRAPEVVVVDAGPSRAVRAGRWTLPSQRGMHALLGLAEPHVVEKTGATFKLALEHNGWQGEGSRCVHAHGEIGLEFGGSPFYKYLVSEALAGRPARPEAFSVAGAAARLGRFARPMGEGHALTSSFTYGFHLDDTAYTDYLRLHAVKLGVRTAAAPLADVRLDASGAIEALRLADGTDVAAELFLDCSGPEARLIERVSSTPREDWSASLPCDSMWSVEAGPLAEPAPVTRTYAAPAGWLWNAPLARASLAGYVFSSRFLDADAALAALRSFSPTAGAAPLLARFAAGRRREFWARNCVALGAAAMELEPLAGADLHFAQLGVATLIELFPRDRASRIEAAEYGRLMADYADRLRDFTLAHYHAGAPRAGEFWSAVRAAELPAPLAAKLDLFRASGRINLLDHESFEETDWAWLLLGSGCRSASLEMQIRLQLARLPAQEVAGLRANIERVAASMPPHGEFVRRQAELAARTGA